MSGKGSNPRPFSVPAEQFAEQFDAIDWGAREREAAMQRARAAEAEAQRMFDEIGGRLCRCRTVDQRRLCADRDTCLRAEAPCA